MKNAAIQSLIEKYYGRTHPTDTVTDVNVEFLVGYGPGTYHFEVDVASTIIEDVGEEAVACLEVRINNEDAVFEQNCTPVTVEEIKQLLQRQFTKSTGYTLHDNITEIEPNKFSYSIEQDGEVENETVKVVIKQLDRKVY